MSSNSLKLFFCIKTWIPTYAVNHSFSVVDQCENTTVCDRDPNGLAYCVDRIDDYKCLCASVRNHAVVWDKSSQSCVFANGGKCGTQLEELVLISFLWGNEVYEENKYY